MFNGATAAATMAIGTRDNLMLPTIGAAVAINIDGARPRHVSGRYGRGRLSVTGGAFNQLLGVELDMRPAGRR